MKIGVFDSGVGGLSIVNIIKEELPEHEVIFINDTANMPYGDKTKEQLLKLVIPKLNMLTNMGCEVIVIACNTVTTNIVNKLREVVAVPIVAVEPMVKTASQITKNKVITVCATPATLRSNRYLQLKNEFAKDILVVEPDCSKWSQMIEDNQIDRDEIESVIKYSKNKNSDVVVLACTHYHWIEDMINELSGNGIIVLQPEEPLVNQLKRVIEQIS